MMQMIVLENLTKYNEAIKDLVKSGYEYWKILIHREPVKKKMFTWRQTWIEKNLNKENDKRSGAEGSGSLPTAHTEA